MYIIIYIIYTVTWNTTYSIFLKHSLARNNIGLDKLRPHAIGAGQALYRCVSGCLAWQRTLQTWPGGTLVQSMHFAGCLGRCAFPSYFQRLKHSLL